MFGLVFGFFTRQILKLIKRGGHNAPEQLSLSLAMAYLVFYISQVGRLAPHYTWLSTHAFHTTTTSPPLQLLWT